jgi:multiple sugar transport system permease protein
MQTIDVKTGSGQPQIEGVSKPPSRWPKVGAFAVKHGLLLLLAAVVLYPFIWLLFSSLKSDAEFLGAPTTLLPATFTVEAYTGVWSRIPFLAFYKNTVIFAGSVTLISLLFDSMAGYAFARLRFKGRNVLFILVLSTMMIPFQVIMIPLFVEIYKLGMIDTYWGLIIPRATSAFGIFMMRQFFLSLPRDLEEAARIDGCSEIRIYRSIMLPLCKPAFASLGIFHLMANWNDLLYPMLITSSNEMRPIQAGIALLVGKYMTEYNYVMASSWLALLPILVAYLFAQRYFIKGIAMTGIK